MGNHRAGGVRRAHEVASGKGKRRATAAATPRVRFLPAMPLAAGVAVLAVAAGGAWQSSVPEQTAVQAAAPAPRLAAVGAMSGTSAMARASELGSRTVISRSSRRGAFGSQSGLSPLQAQTEKLAQGRTTLFAQFNRLAQARSADIERNAWVLPVSGYRLTAGFGESSGLWSSTHTGLDFALPSGSSVVSVARGTVTSAGYEGAYGNQLVITLEDGTEIWYCHLTSFVVSVGETVAAGDLVAYSGSTGNSTGPHLHLEVRPGGGDPVDPYEALIAHGVTP